MNSEARWRKLLLFDLSLLQVSLHTFYVHIGEIDHWTPCLNHCHCTPKVPTQSTENCQSHHRSSMHPCGTVNEQLAFVLVQSLQRKVHPLMEQFWWLQSKIIVRRIPQHRYAMRLCKRAVVELDLHIDDVSNARSRDFCHLLRSPDSPTDRNAISNPCHVHSSILYRMCALSPLGCRNRRIFSPQSPLHFTAGAENAVSNPGFCPSGCIRRSKRSDSFFPNSFWAGCTSSLFIGSRPTASNKYFIA